MSRLAARVVTVGIAGRAVVAIAVVIVTVVAVVVVVLPIAIAVAVARAVVSVPVGIAVATAVVSIVPSAFMPLRRVVTEPAGGRCRRQPKTQSANNQGCRE